MPPKPQASVTVTQEFRTTVEQLFDAWLKPAMVGKWMFGPPLSDEEVLHIEIDPQVGGNFSFLVRRQGQEIDHVGTYLDIDRPHRIAFTWGTVQDAATSRVIIRIEPTGGGARLTLSHELDPAWADHSDRIRDSWSKMLGLLGRILAV